MIEDIADILAELDANGIAVVFLLTAIISKATVRHRKIILNFARRLTE